jgi:hypothetical protein
MVQQSPFCGTALEDANAHLQHFLEICNTLTIRGVTQNAIHLRLFPFSLLGMAKQWFYSNKEAMSTWEKYSNAFLAKFFLLGKTNALQNTIAAFQQLTVRPSPRHGNAYMIISLHAPSRHGGVVHHPNLLSWVDSLSSGADRCCCLRFFLRSQY